MNSILQVLALCLLLKACEANFNQALQEKSGYDLPLLEALAVVVGNYSNAHQMSLHQEHYGILFVDAVECDFVPLDIPALNQNYPVLFVQVHDGGRYRILIKLYTVDEIGQYTSRGYDIPELHKYLSGERDFADLTLDDIMSPTPLCTDVLVRRKDIVVALTECLLDAHGNSVVYSLNHKCPAYDVVVGEGAPELNTGIPYIFNKTHSYSLPESWLAGYDSYINPCGSC